MLTSSVVGPLLSVAGASELCGAALFFLRIFSRLWRLLLDTMLVRRPLVSFIPFPVLIDALILIAEISSSLKRQLMVPCLVPSHCRIPLFPSKRALSWTTIPIAVSLCGIGSIPHHFNLTLVCGILGLELSLMKHIGGDTHLRYVLFHSFFPEKDSD